MNLKIKNVMFVAMFLSIICVVRWIISHVGVVWIPESGHAIVETGYNAIIYVSPFFLAGLALGRFVYCAGIHRQCIKYLEHESEIDKIWVETEFKLVAKEREDAINIRAEAEKMIAESRRILLNAQTLSNAVESYSNPPSIL